MRLCKTILAGLAVTGMLIPVPVWAADPTEGDQPPELLKRLTVVNDTRDVRLDAHQALRGRLFGAAGQPLPTETITLVHNGAALATAVTDAAGGFRFEQLGGGVYSLRHGDEVTVCRAWTTAAAPPAAVSDLLLVDGNAMRGQNPFCCFFGAEPIMIGVLLAAAIAIPISVRDSGSDQPPSSP